MAEAEGGANPDNDRQVLLNRVRSEYKEIVASVRRLVFVASGAYLAIVLMAIYVKWLSRNDQRPRNIPLTMSLGTGTDILAVLASVVIALNVGIWTTRSSSRSIAGSDATGSGHRARAVLLARYIALLRVAEICGGVAVIVGWASGLRAVFDADYVPGMSVIVAAIAIAAISHDTSSGLSEGPQIEESVNRDHRQENLARLRKVTGADDSAVWSDRRTMPKWRSGRVLPVAWWLYELVTAILISAAVPLLALVITSIKSDGEEIRPAAFAVVVALSTASVLVVGFVTRYLVCGLIDQELIMTALMAILMAVAWLVYALGAVSVYTSVDGHSRVTAAVVMALVVPPIVAFLLCLNSLRTAHSGASWIPGTVLRRSIRSHVLRRISRLEAASGADQSDPRRSSGRRIWFWQRWYRAVSGIDDARA
ncbi:hypothetical protein [Nocardia brasiliensis]|uniref:hypothetical protein n=1 Tax=Nocardia brasiliensis TaxID=37326 RepID=UPI0024573AE6|nr:hypothetical protein [Nocardia brasiliensis]